MRACAQRDRREAAAGSCFPGRIRETSPSSHENKRTGILPIFDVVGEKKAHRQLFGQCNTIYDETNGQKTASVPYSRHRLELRCQIISSSRRSRNLLSLLQHPLSVVRVYPAEYHPLLAASQFNAKEKDEETTEQSWLCLGIWDKRYPIERMQMSVLQSFDGMGHGSTSCSYEEGVLLQR